MLDTVPAPELVAATVEKSIIPYAEEHGIPFNELLLQYIKVKSQPNPLMIHVFSKCSVVA